MTVPAGLTAQLVASEPLVRQPVAMEFDDAGRLWVIQYLQYPNPAGLTRAKVDRYSRTTYDRVPEPPPRGPQGADRITILIDADGDGRAESAKDFVGGLNLASGLAFGHGGVFVLQVPYLLFYADRNRDDVPDGEPEVLLTGFGMEDAHSVANSLTWGPDGWLYGCQGSTVTSNIRGIEFQQGVWRYHPLSKRFELFCEGGGNSWGLDFDAQGNLFYSTNYGGYAMLHGVQGAYYWKQFGKHGALHNPYAYGYFDHVPHKDLRGGHVTVGGVIYQGDSLGEQYQGKYIAADLLGHAMYWHDLQPRGATFAARLAGDLLVANDTWFAPSDVTVGPDGAIYVCDWHDARTAHPDPDADWDRRNGRVYRIVSQQGGSALPVAPVEPAKLASLASQQLVELLGHANHWYVRKARRLLADRRDESVVAALRSQVMSGDDEARCLEARCLETLWALYVSGGWSDDLAMRLLDHPQAGVRWWTVRLLGDEGRVTPALAQRLSRLAAEDPSDRVRCQLAASAQRLPAGEALSIIRQLLARDEDVSDPYLPLMLWWAVEKHSETAREAVVALACDPRSAGWPLVREAVADRLVRRYAAEASTPGYEACARLLAAAAPEDRSRRAAALEQGLRDRGASGGGSAGTLFANLAVANDKAATSAVAAPKIPTALLDEIDRLWTAAPADRDVLRMAARVGRPTAIERVRQVSSDASQTVAERVDAVRLLGEVDAPGSVELLLGIFAQGSPTAVQAAALDALRLVDDPRVATALFASVPKAEPALKTKACDALLGRKSWAARLLGAVDEGTLVAKEIAVEQLRVVALHQDKQLDALVKKHWGAIQGGTPEERLAEMRRINNDLRASRGDVAAGKALFGKHCGTCHQMYGEGQQIGPELTHANRKNTDELLQTIVNPSAVIRKEYLSFLLHTTDGQVLTGLLVEQTPGSVTLLSAKNERTVIARDKIEELVESPTSLMPENLLGPLKPQELRDLFSYLQSDAPAGK